MEANTRLSDSTIDEQLIRERIEKILESGFSPEEACADCPEIIPYVKIRLSEVQRIERQLDQFFQSAGSKIDVRPKVPTSVPASMPEIAGYEVVSLLGCGGMGAVYLANHLRLDRTVALKMLLRGTYASKQDVARFVRESQAVATLQHPNIVQVHDAGELNGCPYFTMEYVEGENLADRLAGAPQLGQYAAQVMAILANAVHFAHSKGIIHRDLKPANILLSGDNEVVKIADFGLARHIEGDTQLTLTGAMVGTPSYMAPEQTLGDKSAIGPAVDIYALGAILYEMLTGRPPFRAATALETQRQVLMVDVVRPSSLNTSVPRDLETICLKCLQKEPLRRYATAGALAEDLKRYQRREPILARPVGKIEKAVKWTKRNRLIAGAALSGVLVCIVAAAIGWRFTLDRMLVEQAAENDLEEVKAALLQQDWNVAKSALNRAEGRLGGAGRDALSKRIDQYRKELQLVDQLDSIRLKRANSEPGADRFGNTAAAYEKLFREAGLLKLEEDPQSAAERIRSATVAPAMLVAIDDWSMLARESKQADLLRTVARRIDTNTNNAAIRDALAQTDPQVLQKLAADIPIEGQSVALMVAIGRQIHLNDGDAAPFMKRVHQVYPEDFWVNLVLAMSTHRQNPAESIRYYQAAIAIRPNCAEVHDNLGTALVAGGRFEEALSEYEIATRVDPLAAHFLYNYGVILGHVGQYESAIDVLRRVSEIRPGDADCLAAIGLNLLELNRAAEAIAECHRAIALEPTLWGAYKTIRSSQLKLGQTAGALAIWQEMLAQNPPGHEEWDGYAELCLFLDRPDEYREARQNLLKRFGETTDPFIAERTGRSCLFLAPTPDELQQATALVDLALNHESPKARGYWRYHRFAKALANYRAGHFATASEYLDDDTLQVLGPAPRLLLAMIQHQLDRKEEALQNYKAAIAAEDWNLEQATTPDKWRYHLLRREAEAVLKTSL